MKSYIYSKINRIHWRLAALLLFFTLATYVSVDAGGVAAAKNTLSDGNLSDENLSTAESISCDTQKSLASKVIRFHVLANSDSDEDQNLKMKVKEAVVDYIYAGAAGYTSLEETRAFLKAHRDEIIALAAEIIEDNGYDYEVNAGLTTSEFPEKSYGDVTFPEGTYESFTITIGSGGGHNWWCVLYPPLCFVDASTGVLPDSSKEMLKEELTDNEYAAICSSDNDNDSSNNSTYSDDENNNAAENSGGVCIRFKYLTFLNKLFE